MPARNVSEKESGVGHASALTKIREEVTDLYWAVAAGLLRYLLCIAKDFDLAQEAVQEAFLRYYVCRLRGEPAPASKGWIFRVARNYVIDRVRSASLAGLVDLEKALGLSDPRHGPHDAFEHAETIEQIYSVLAPRELECLRLRAEGFKYKEIAEILEIEPGTVGATLTRGLKKIRKVLVRKEGADAKRVKSGRRAVIQAFPNPSGNFRPTSV